MTELILEKPKEEKELLELTTVIPKEKIDLIKQNLDVLSMLIRAFEGQDINPENDIITRLINIKNILERSNFPSMPIINFQVYCRLVAKYHPELEAFQQWANYQAEALKSYKALSSEQYVDMVKSTSGLPAQPLTNINLNPMAQQQQQKRGLFRRAPRDQREQQKYVDDKE